MNTQEAVKIIQGVGGVEIRHKGGEIILLRPGKPPVRTSHWTRRKDASRELVLLVKEVLRERGAV